MATRRAPAEVPRFATPMVPMILPVESWKLARMSCVHFAACTAFWIFSPTTAFLHTLSVRRARIR